MQWGITLLFVSQSFLSLLFIAVMYLLKNKLMIQYIPHSFLPLHCGLGFFKYSCMSGCNIESFDHYRKFLNYSIKKHFPRLFLQ